MVSKKLGNRKKVAIMTVVYKETLKDHEKFSLEFSKKNLSKYDRIVVTPESLEKLPKELKSIKFKIEKFPNSCFNSTKEYNDLVMSSEFYKRFKDYKYILFCEFDTLVFKDSLNEFCSLNYDFIGAPFIKNKLREIKNPNKMKHRGGGLSLRKVDSFIKVCEILENKKSKNSWFWRYYLKNFFHYNEGLIKGLIKGKRNRSNLFTINEDIFWSYGAEKIDSSFKVAPFKTAISFSFENNVPLCFKLNNNNLPFGCHAFQCEKNMREWKKLGVFEKSD